MTPPTEATFIVPQERFEQLEQAVHRIDQFITGGTSADPGMKGRQADHEARIARLEAFVKWLAGIGTAAITTLVATALVALSAIKR